MSAALPPRWRPEPQPVGREGADFLDGYEQALLNLEEETLHLIGRAYGPKELRVLFRARVGDLVREVRERRRGIEQSRAPPRTEPTARSDQARSASPGSPPSATRPTVDLSPTQSVLVATGELAPALWLVAAEVARGRKAMCFARANPTQIRASGLGEATIWWLTGESSRPASDARVKILAPTDFTAMQAEVHKFLTENRGGIVFFEGYEYVREQYRGDPTQPIRLLGVLRDKASALGGTLVVCVDPNAVEAGELGRLQKAVGSSVRLG